MMILQIQQPRCNEMKKGFHARDYKFAPTAVTFSTADKELQGAYDRAEDLLKRNETQYNDRLVLREGATYPFVWLETQPLGGEMYAKRNMEIGLNNLLIFLQYQRKDGRFPGMISQMGRGNGIVGHYDWMQGFYFALPGLKLAYLLNKDPLFLERLYSGLADFDDYLWTYRDSDGDGCLEVWCCWDTAEDNCTRYTRHGAPDGGHGCFGGETAPYGIGDLPLESLEYMNYSYACRDTLAKISDLLDNGKGDFWREQAETVRRRVIDGLWDPKKHACFDRDGADRILNCLDHTNLRAMYHGTFTQEMADEFLYYHLFNPEEFWTPSPLCAIAANNEYFVNDNYNNWSGQCQGLIYQRSVDAFHNYGHYAGAVAVGRHVVELGRKYRVFHQQYDPFTGEPDPRKDGYGPMMFAFTEYLSFLWGINISMDRVSWSNASAGADSEYEQQMFGREYRLSRKGGIAAALLDGEELFSFTEGLRVVSCRDGRILQVICLEEIDDGEVRTKEGSFRGPVEPNGIYECREGQLIRVGGAKYLKPGTKPEDKTREEHR